MPDFLEASSETGKSRDQLTVPNSGVFFGFAWQLVSMRQRNRNVFTQVGGRNPDSIPGKGLYLSSDWCLLIEMKRSLLILAACLTPSFAELPQMSDKTEWLGYFVGWEGRNFDFGIGADGESLLHPKKSGKRVGHKEIHLRYIVEEEVKGKWVRRNILKEEGLKSENKKGLDPKKPIVFTMVVTGGTMIEWTHVPSRGEFAVMPKVLEKKTENEIRVGIEITLPLLYRFDKLPEKRELKQKLGSDFVRGTRLKDGKKVRVKFSSLDDDINSEKFLEDGASAVEVKSNAIMGRTLVIESGDEKSSRIDLITKGPLYSSFKIRWMAETAKLGEKQTYVTFSVE